jgi:ABC-type antimicrobial peptide transport system permease subunit
MFIQEIRNAMRLFASSPGFTAVAVVSLALGIGLNAAIFSGADALLLRPLPPEPRNICTVSVHSLEDLVDGSAISYPDYRDLREQSRSFGGMVAFEYAPLSFTSSADALPEMRLGVLVSDNFFSTLQVSPFIGRSFLPGEGVVPGRDLVVVLAYDFWKNELAADRSLVNRSVRINGIDFNVIGVTPPDFTGIHSLLRPPFYVPLTMAQRLTGAADAAGMLIDGFSRNLTQSPGFRTDRLMTMEFDPALVRLNAAQSGEFYRNLVERAKALPGVRSVAMASVLPLGGRNVEELIPEGYVFPTPNPATYVLVPLSLVVLTIGACYVPARRAASIDPVRAMRHE